MKKMAGQNTFCGGWCKRCQRPHFIDTWLARPAALRLIRFFDRHGHINVAGLQGPGELFSLAPLFGPARGKMFGVLLCRDKNGGTKILHAFSGQMNASWQIPGWAEPLFNVDAFTCVHDPEEKAIKAMGRALAGLDPGGRAADELRRKRKKRSARLMEAIFSLYGFTDFAGRRQSLVRAHAGRGNMPTGTGDCCAPKLLAQAARQGLYPVSLAEFYYGRPNRSGTRQHGRFYSSCADKCQPILGAMLCGRERLLHRRVASAGPETIHGHNTNPLY